QCGPRGRVMPRWSTEGQPASSAAFSAGLPYSNAGVSVLPPFFNSASSIALVFCRSPVCALGKDPLDRLWPPDENVALPPSATLFPPEFDRIVFFTLTMPPCIHRPLVLALSAALLGTVLFMICVLGAGMPSAVYWSMAPPAPCVPLCAWLPINVLLRIVSVPL